MITDDEVDNLKDSVNQKVTQYKLLLNDKNALFEEMHSKALLMINRDRQIIANEEEIVQLKHEIDINILEIEQKTAIISELQEDLKQKKQLCKKLKLEIKELEEQCEELQNILQQKEEYYDMLEDVLRDKEMMIEALEKTLGEKAPVLDEVDRAKGNQKNIYKALEGDETDILLAKYINELHITMPIRRLEAGYYMFGTRKIYAKIMNERLVVRVGGGYMSFTEFYETYNN